MSSPKTSGNTRKRGHQHHPRNEGTRRRIALNNPSNDIAFSEYSKNNIVTVKQKQEKMTNKTTVINKGAFPEEISTSKQNYTQKIPNKCDNEVIDLTNCDDENFGTLETQEADINVNSTNITNDRKKSRKVRKNKNKNEVKVDMSLVFRPEAEGSSLSDQEFNEENLLDPETEELSKLRCTSEMTEVVAEREKRHSRRCADYPGLAFASSIFSSDTLMKFSIIRNELHNIMNSQLKRVGTFITCFVFEQITINKQGDFHLFSKYRNSQIV